MPRIHYYVHGRGRGHATRSRAVITRLLDAGHEVIAFAGHSAEPLLRDKVHTEGVMSILPSAGPRAALQIAGRTRAAATAMELDEADVVVSDGDLPALLGARAARRPSIAVGHGLVFYCCTRPQQLPTARWIRESLKAGASSLGAHRLVAVNFVPLPLRRGRLARPGLELGPATPRTSDGPLLCYFRDGAPSSLLRRLAGLGVPVVLFSTTDPQIPGIVHEPPGRARFMQVLRSARAVLATGGSQLISECIALGAPLFAVHALDDDEQALNVAMLRHAGLGDGCPLLELDVAQLLAFIERPAAAVAPQWDAPDVATVVLEEVDDLLRGPA